MTKACGTCNPCTRISILPPKASPYGWTVLPECSPFPYNLNAKPPTQFCCAGGFVLCLAFLQGCVYNNRAVVLLHRAQLPDSNCLSSSAGYSTRLLSVGPEVQILSGTPESTAASLFRGLQRFFVSPSPGNFTSVTGRFLCAA